MDANDPALYFQNSTTVWSLNPLGADLQLKHGNTINYLIDTAGHFKPGQDNAYNLGSSSNRFATIYAATGTINTSDERQKENIEKLDVGLSFLLDLEAISYTWKIGKNIVSEKIVGYEKREIRPETVLKGETYPAVFEDVPIIETEVTPQSGKRTHWGFSAQQVKRTLDKHGLDSGLWVQSDLDNPQSDQGLRPDQLLPVIVKAIQELDNRIKSLERNS
ncbi:hypothetical protein GRI33_03900 [Brucella sp. BO3]|uniref:tail fiber domain-containing protein n=1 Tax=unclassified Brucella TaxID=2632610 RepID=UPI00084F8EE6|nr:MULTISPECIES: tail fiber domain-containing protein [unclassified Brucella]OEI82701.1 hypothetical protein BA060_13245 [Brucella sp. B13-0095]QMV26116.1 hypothetical protein GRI33_03900 [Brucella sp. BO3]